MGDATSQKINAIVTTGASTTVALLTALHVAALGGPVGVAIGAAIAVGSLIANMFQGCGSRCIVASQDADKFEAPLKQNLAAYFAVPAPRPASLQAACLNNVDTLFEALRTACSDPNLGDPGRRCISERLDSNACHWQNAGDNTPAGSGTQCWNWVKGYRDPIANDPNVVPDPSPVSQVSDAGSSLLQTFGVPSTVFGMSLSDLLLPVGLIGLAFLLPSGKR